MVNDADILNANILVMDDHYSNVLLLERILRQAGYACVTSTIDPYAVCKLHQDNHYDLILLDMQMYGMDGFQVMESLNKIESDGYLPVIVITAQPSYRLRALTTGAIDFIAKPFDLGEVQARVYNMLKVRLLYKKLKNANKALEQTIKEREQTIKELEQTIKKLEQTVQWTPNLSQRTAQ